MTAKRNTKIFSLSFPPDFLKQVDKFAREENKNRTALVKDALRYYIEKRTRDKLRLKRLEKGLK